MAVHSNVKLSKEEMCKWMENDNVIIGSDLPNGNRVWIHSNAGYIENGNWVTLRVYKLTRPDDSCMYHVLYSKIEEVVDRVYNKSDKWDIVDFSKGA